MTDMGAPGAEGEGTAGPRGAGVWSDTIDYPAASHILRSLELDEPGSPAPSEIPGFRIERRVGEGGCGDVYLAFREGSDRALALKVLARRLGDGPEARRAWRELDVLGQLRLPCVPRLIDYGLYGGRLFIATEFIRGSRLDRHCKDRGLSRAQRVELLAAVADAVQSLHERGVIHRDLKPSNILIDEQNQPVLIDLGIAALQSAAGDTITRPGELVGSLAYMAPEQARGERGSISTRSDVYGLGATAYMLLAGQTPHDAGASLHEAIRQVAHDPPRDPRRLDPTLPRPLAAILLKAVAPRPEHRYASAAAMAADLRRWLNHEPIEAAGRTMTQRCAGLIARHPVLATLALCVAIGLLTVVSTSAVVWWMHGQPAELGIEGNSVHLKSRSGRVTHTWTHEPPLKLVSATFVQRPRELGGGRVVLLAYTSETYHPQAQLFLYDPRRPDRPTWSSGTEPPEIAMPVPISVVDGDRYGLASVRLLDIFPDLPGDEIVAVHGHKLYSPNVLRVYDLAGRILYQVWHDGWIGSWIWLPRDGLIVCTGLNSENNWKGRGFPDIANAIYPMTVFALRPRPGDVHQAYIHTPGGLGTVEPIWYKAFQPPHTVDSLHAARRGLLHGIELSRMVLPEEAEEFTVWLGVNPLRLSFVLDTAGRVRSAVGSLPYEQRRGTTPELPPAEAFRLDDLPPLLIDPRSPPP